MKEGSANADYSHIDREKRRHIRQLGGVSYGQITSTLERPRKKWDQEVLKSKPLAKFDANKPDVE